MIPSAPLPKNEFVSIKDNLIEITCNQRLISFPIQTISKIYLTKCKYGYWHRIVGEMLDIPNTSYHLHIETRDGLDVIIKINPYERFFFIRLISIVRHATVANSQYSFPYQVRSA